MKDTEQYKALPAKVSSTVLLMVQKNFKSYFKANSDYYKTPSKYKGKPKLPKYLNTTNGKFFVSYTNQAISKKVFKKTNKIKLSGNNIEFKTKITDFNQINCIRIIPKLGYNVIEVVYTISDVTKLENNDKYCSIDLGVNNLATIGSNTITPFIINGKPLKSINQYYNKKYAYYKSILEKRNNKKTSNYLHKLNLKRKNKIDNYLHKGSKEIVNICKINNINTLVIGKNDGWKQDINIGKQNNQNFVNIPHSRFIDMLNYKCEREGINVILQEESYTSKCSFLDDESIKKHDVYKGSRIKRGLFKSAKGTLINADLNGSYNILKKAIPNAFANGIEGVGVHPKVITLK
jgi:putative transposase